MRIVGVSQNADRALEAWAGRLAGTAANYGVLHVNSRAGQPPSISGEHRLALERGRAQEARRGARFPASKCQANDTGRFEIYVRPFPGPGGWWLISPDRCCSGGLRRSEARPVRRRSRLTGRDVTRGAGPRVDPFGRPGARARMRRRRRRLRSRRRWPRARPGRCPADTRPGCRSRCPPTRASRAARA